MSNGVVGLWKYHIAIVNNVFAALDVMMAPGNGDHWQQEGRQG
jgi:hypothetical protein